MNRAEIIGQLEQFAAGAYTHTDGADALYLSWRQWFEEVHKFIPVSFKLLDDRKLTGVTVPAAPPWACVPGYEPDDDPAVYSAAYHRFRTAPAPEPKPEAAKARVSKRLDEFVAQVVREAARARAEEAARKTAYDRQAEIARVKSASGQAGETF